MTNPPPGPATPRIKHLIEEELHLVISCGRCRREIRLTPAEAVEALDADCTILHARARLRCAWCGARGPDIDVRPCNQDMDAQRALWTAQNALRMWPGEARAEADLERAKAAWEKRRPRDSLEGMCNLYTIKPNLLDWAQAVEAVLGLPLSLPAGEATLSNQPWATTMYPAYQGLFMRPVEAANPSAGLEPAVGRWGLVPFFHNGPAKAWKLSTNNARSETMSTSGTFKLSVKERRCIVPATAIFEYSGPKGSKTKHAISRADGGPLFLAGLWAAHVWEGETSESYTMVMQDTQPGDDMHVFHNRQPVFLDRAGAARWLDLGADVAPLLQGPPPGTLIADPPQPVSGLLL